MEEILEKLNNTVGIVGSMIVTQDGMVVASRLGQQFSEDTVAALSASTISSCKNALERIEFGRFAGFIFQATSGKMIFVEAGSAYLLVLTDQKILLDQSIIDIKGAAYRIGRKARMS